MDKRAMFPGVVKLLVVGDGDPRLRRLIVILRIVITFFGGGETQFG